MKEERRILAREKLKDWSKKDTTQGQRKGKLGRVWEGKRIGDPRDNSLKLFLVSLEEEAHRGVINEIGPIKN